MTYILIGLLVLAIILMSGRSKDNKPHVTGNSGYHKSNGSQR